MKTKTAKRHLHGAVWAFGLLLLGVLLACGCSPREQKRVVTVSIEPQKWLLEQIVGDKAEVKSLLAGSANPETYDPTVANLRDVGQSMAYMRVGNVGFEEAVVEKIKASNAGLPVYDTSKGIKPIYGTHACGHGHHHEQIDPHTWTSVKNAKIMAGNMARAMAEVDAANAGYYRQRGARLASRLDSLDAAFGRRLARAKGSAFAVWHPSLSYFARDYGLEQVVTGGAENREISPTAMRKAIEEARNTGVRVYFSQRDFDSRQSASINANLGAEVVEINPMSADWQGEMEKITSSLER